MDALVEFLGRAALPLNVRPNVARDKVHSVTLGAVDGRARGYAVSAATTLHRGELLRLLHGVARDGGLQGEGPGCYTSVCVNVGFACALHVDGRNEGPSFLVAGGEYTGGALFIEGDGADGYTAQEDVALGSRSVCAGTVLKGKDHDVRRRWVRFDGSRAHAVRPFSGDGVSVVCFHVPHEKLTARLERQLRALGFPTGAQPPSALRQPKPYRIFLCTAGRAGTIAGHTLRVLFEDGTVGPGDVTLCVREADAAAYASLGLDTLVGVDVDPLCGLPEQRRLCLHALPNGTWCLFVDDDLTSIEKLHAVCLHDLIMQGFLTAAQRKSSLWGLNASPHYLRDNVSSCLGLVCGYFYGMVHDASNPQLLLSDRVQGAAEDIERSLRFYHAGGIVRLNWAAASAKTWTNGGGLQGAFGVRAARQAAHDWVVWSLAREYPESLVHDATRPNRCRFLSGAGSQLVDVLPTPRVAKACRPRAAPLACEECGKTYARRADLVHHATVQHGSVRERHTCPRCGKPFLKAKDMRVHLLGGRCYSRRGRPHADCALPAQ